MSAAAKAVVIAVTYRTRDLYPPSHFENEILSRMELNSDEKLFILRAYWRHFLYNCGTFQAFQDFDLNPLQPSITLGMDEFQALVQNRTGWIAATGVDYCRVIKSFDLGEVRRWWLGAPAEVPPGLVDQIAVAIARRAEALGEPLDPACPDDARILAHA